MAADGGYFGPREITEEQRQLARAAFQKYYPDSRLEAERTLPRDPVIKSPDGIDSDYFLDEPAKPESTPQVVPQSTTFTPPRTAPETNVATGPAVTGQRSALPDWSPEEATGTRYSRPRDMVATDTSAIPEDASAALKASGGAAWEPPTPRYTLDPFAEPSSLAPSPGDTRTATSDEGWSPVGAAFSIAGRRAGDIAGNLFDLGSQLSTYAAEGAEELGLDPVASISYATGRFLENVGNWASSIQEETGYQPKITPTAAWQALKDGNPLPTMMMMAESMPSVVVDVAAAGLVFPAYVASMAQDFATDRAVNDDRDPNHLTMEDYAYGAPLGLASAFVDKMLGSGKTVKVVGDFLGIVRKEAPGIWRRLAVGAGEGAVTEGVSGGIEAAGTLVNTKKAQELGPSGVAGEIGLGVFSEAVAGAPVGGLVHAVTGGQTVTEDGIGEDAAAALGQAAVQATALGGQPLGAIPEPPQIAGPEARLALPPPSAENGGIPPPIELPPPPGPGDAGAAAAIPPPEQPLPAGPGPVAVTPEGDLIAEPGEDEEEAELEGKEELDENLYDRITTGATAAQVRKQSRKLASTAGAQILGVAGRGDGGIYAPPEAVMQAGDRQALESVFQKAADLARRHMGQLKAHAATLDKAESKEQRAVAKHFANLSLIFSRARADIASLGDDTLKSPSPDFLQTLFYDPTIIAGLQAMGVTQGNALPKAALDPNVDVLRAELARIDSIADDKLATFAGELAELPSQDVRGGTEVRTQAERTAMEARNVLRETQRRDWSGRTTAPLRKASELNRDWSGTPDTNPNYGQLLPGSTLAKTVEELRGGREAGEEGPMAEGLRPLKAKMDAPRKTVGAIIKERVAEEEATEERRLSGEYNVPRELRESQERTDEQFKAAVKANAERAMQLAHAELTEELKALDVHARPRQRAAVAPQAVTPQSYASRLAQESLTAETAEASHVKANQAIYDDMVLPGILAALDEEIAAASELIKGADLASGVNKAVVRRVARKMKAAAVSKRRELQAALNARNKSGGTPDRRLASALATWERTHQGRSLSELREFIAKRRDLIAKARFEASQAPVGRGLGGGVTVRVLKNLTEEGDAAAEAQAGAAAAGADTEAKAVKAGEKQDTAGEAVVEKVPPTKAEEYRREIGRALSRHQMLIRRGLRAGDMDRLKALAGRVWAGRKSSPPKTGIYIYDANASEREPNPDAPPLPPGKWPFTWISNGMPGIMTAKEAADAGLPAGVYHRHVPDFAMVNGKKVFFLHPGQVVQSPIGWRYGEDYYIKGQEGFGKSRMGLKPLPVNANIFDQKAVDALVNELSVQGAANNLADLRAMATYLVDSASRKNYTNRSGARGHEGGKRQNIAWGNIERPPAVKRKPRAVKIDAGGKVTPVDGPVPRTTVAPPQLPTPAAPPAVPPAPPAAAAPTAKPTAEPTEEFTGPGGVPTREDVINAIKAAIDSLVEDDKYRPDDADEATVSRIKQLKEKAVQQLLDLTTARDMLDRLREMVQDLEIEDDIMVLEIQEGTLWPSTAGWRQQFGAFVEDGKIGGKKFSGDLVEAHKARIMDDVNEHVDHQERIYQQTLEDIRNAQASGTQGGGGRRKKQAAKPAQPAPPPAAPPGLPGPHPSVPGTPGYEHPRAPQRGGGIGRRTVDNFAGIVRDPGGKSNVFDKYGSSSGKGSVEGSAGLSDEQKKTAQQVLYRYGKRLAILAKDGFKNAVNAAGFLVMNGTGSGKTRIAAVTAEEIWQAQTGDKKKVLIVHQNGLRGNFTGDDNKPGAFRELGLDPNNGHYSFVAYDQMKNISKTTEYAAVIFDESHNIKQAERVGEWAISADSINAQFRVFLSATPTDVPMQETYYLAYMNPDDTTPRTFEEEMKAVRLELGTAYTDSQGKVVPYATTKDWANAAKRDPELVTKYIKAIDRMMAERVKHNMATSYTLESMTEGDRVDVTDLDPEIMAAIARATSDDAKAYMNEHLKVPDMVKGTMAALERGDNTGVANVFYVANVPEKSYRSQIPQKILGKVAMDAYQDQLIEAATAQGYGVFLLDRDNDKGVQLVQSRNGKNVRIGVIKGATGKGATGRRKMSSEEENQLFVDTAGAFRRGDLNVLIMSEAKAGTGVDLDDYTGTAPKLMQVANTRLIGSAWIQLMGRIDRQSTQTPARVHFFATGTAHDNQYRQRIKDKVELQRRVTGALAAHDAGIINLQNELERKIRRPTFSAARHETPVDAMLKDRLLGSREVSAADLVSQIANNETDAPLAALAGAMQGHPALVGIRAVPMSRADVVATRGAQGYAEGGIIALDPSAGGWLAITTLHEAAHHVTHQAIDNDLNRRRLLQIMRHVPLTVMPGVEGIHTDPHEFVAEAFSNPGFQAELQKIQVPATKRNLWEHFVDFVKSLFGARGSTLPAWNAMLELRLTEPDTVTNIGHGDPSAQLATRMMRTTTDRLTKSRVAMWFADRGENLFPKLLKTLTFHQIVKSFGSDSIDRRNGDEVNHLQRLYNLMRDRFARVNKERAIFDQRVMKRLIDYGRNRKEQRKKISVVMKPGAEPVRMTKMQYLSELMNISGYAKVHFGKDASDKLNSILGDPTKPEFKRSKSNEYWDLHKKQFDELLGAEGQAIYNDLADFFREQIELIDVMRAQQWLDVVAPLPGGQSWSDVAPPAVRAKVEKMGKLPEDELKKLGVSAPSMDKLRAMLEPGRVPGAYFPLKRFGNWVVTVDERASYDTEEERDALLKQYLGSYDDAKNGEIVYKAVSRFESQAEARRFIDQMRDEYPAAAVSEVMLSSSTKLKQEVAFSSDLVSAFEKRIDAEDLTQGQKDAQKSLFLQSMIDLMPESSYADTFRPRKGILGASTDAIRSLASYGSALSHYKGAAVFASQQRNANRDFEQFIYYVERTTAPQIKEELQGKERGPLHRKLRSIINELAAKELQATTAFTDGKWLQSFNNVGFAYYLVGASYNIVNATQPALITTPYLAGRFGMVKTLNAMSKAYRLVGPVPARKMIGSGMTVTQLKGMFTGEDFDKNNYAILKEITARLGPEHKKLLETLAERNQIEATIAMDMAQAAERSHIDPLTGATKRQGKLSYLSEWMRTAPHIVEVLNRSVTAIAAYDLELARLKSKGDPEASAKATEYAADAIDETQFNYQNWNKPSVLQKPMMRAILMFKQHPQHVYYYMLSRAIKSSRALTKKVKGQKLTPDEALEAREATRQLGYFVGMHMLAAGAIGGTPEPIKWMIGALMMVLGDDDEPFDFELWVQNWMNDWGGPTLGDMGARGLLAGLGIDLTSRFGINSLLLFDTPDMDSQDAFVADVARLAGGPLFSLGQRFTFDAYHAIEEGNYWNLARAVTPKVFRDAIHAEQLYADNGFRTSAGRVFSESSQLTPYNYILTAMGFTPTSTSEMYLSRTVEYQAQALGDKRSKIMKRAYFAVESGDRAARDSVNAEIHRWNADHPEYPIDVPRLHQSYVSRRREQAKTIAGINAPAKELRPWIDRKNRFRGLPQPTD